MLVRDGEQRCCPGGGVAAVEKLLELGEVSLGIGSTATIAESELRDTAGTYGSRLLVSCLSWGYGWGGAAS